MDQFMKLSPRSNLYRCSRIHLNLTIDGAFQRKMKNASVYEAIRSLYNVERKGVRGVVSGTEPGPTKMMGQK